MKKLVVWGTGLEYEKVMPILKYYELKKEFNIVGLTSEDNYYKCLDSWIFIPKSELCNVSFDYLT